MNKTLIIATHNHNKVKEFKEIFKDTNFDILSLVDINFTEEISENGETFQDNAVEKALFVHKKTNLPVIADDSGLMITALDGFPGVHSARFMKEHTASEKNLEIIKRLAGYSDKTAKFVCSIALVGMSTFPEVFVGEAKGVIINEERGSLGFGYDPIFLDQNTNKTFSELEGIEKNAISHRGKAVALLLNYLTNISK